MELRSLWILIDYAMKDSFYKLTPYWPMRDNEMQRFMEYLDFAVERFVSRHSNKQLIIFLAHLHRLADTYERIECRITYMDCLRTINQEVGQWNDRSHFVYNKMCEVNADPPLTYAGKIKAWLMHYLFLSGMV